MSAAIDVAAFVALALYKASVIRVILVCGTIGLVLSAIGRVPRLS
jgi:hypothetical protein